MNDGVSAVQIQKISWGAVAHPQFHETGVTSTQQVIHNK